jgi:hypothetical protein
MHKKVWTGGAALAALVLVGCSDTGVPSEVSAPGPSLAQTVIDPTLDPGPAQRAAALIERVNARFAAKGSEIRVDEGWFFSIGRGTEPYRRLRTGSMWLNPRQVTYILDASDYTKDVSASRVEAALVSAFDSWNAIDNTVLHATRLPDDGKNNDILDGMIFDRAGNCVDIVDLKSPRVLAYDAKTGGIDFDPAADNVFGGWLAPEYFAKCLGSQNIIGVTWTFSLPDGSIDGTTDGYRDRLYTEQYYNTRFNWTDTGSPFLGDDDAPFDIESIVVHETGHSHGLGHFGGPNTNEPFKLQPNGTVFDPEAVMNPFYLGGEKRDPFPTDVSALRTMYTGN